MASALAIGTGVAVAAFLGRAGLVAWRRSRGGVGALGKAFYKGGFEPRMNKREAALILSLKSVPNNTPLLLAFSAPSFSSIQPFQPHIKGRMLTHLGKQRVEHHQGQGPQGAPHAHAAQPPRPRRQPVPGDQGERGQGVFGEEFMIMMFSRRLGLSPSLCNEWKLGSARIRTRHKDFAVDASGRKGRIYHMLGSGSGMMMNGSSIPRRSRAAINLQPAP